MDIQKLKRIRHNVETDVGLDWNTLQSAFKNKHSISVERNSNGLSNGLRHLAILAYLLDGDVYGFFEKNYQAANIFNTYNRFATFGMPYNPDFFRLSNSGGFYAALVTFDFSKLPSVFAAMSRHVLKDSVEANLVLVLRDITFNMPHRGQEFINNLESIQQRYNFIDTTIDIKVCEAFKDLDSVGATKYINKYLMRLADQINEGDTRGGGGFEFISIEGLALIRFARMLGLDVYIDHALAPQDLQIEPPPNSEFQYRYNVCDGLEEKIKDKAFWSDWKPNVV
jgi:hypothetical protein